jgi:enolase-phosphatase E1
MLPLAAVVTSIEGTTTPLSFIRDVLFAFARERFPGFLQTHADDPEVAGQLAEVRRLAPGRSELDVLLHWMEQDAKITPLKALQGMIWREGYRAGALVGAVYPDVPPALRRWRAAGLRLYGFSYGSSEAQRLILSNSSAGDLSGLFSGFFDTRVGSKREPGSFSRLAIGLGRPPAEILYLSDVESELDAAATAGMRTCQVLRRRNGARRSDQHPHVSDFAGVAARMRLNGPGALPLDPAKGREAL